MKRTVAIAMVLLVGVGAVVILVGCAGTRLRRLSGAEFVEQAERIEEMTSFSWTSYVGSSRHRAYLEFEQPAFIGKGTRTTVYWTPLSELPEDLVPQLKAGCPPWTPWLSETNKTKRTEG